MRTTLTGQGELVKLVKSGRTAAGGAGVWNAGVLALGLVCLTLVPVPADAQRLVLLVRHAERADGGVPPAGMAAPADPDLSADGHARAGTARRDAVAGRHHEDRGE